jgi:hypothetical protein
VEVVEEEQGQWLGGVEMSHQALALELELDCWRSGGVEAWFVPVGCPAFFFLFFLSCCCMVL